MRKALALFFCFAAAASAAAQSAITGVVRDPSGAVVSGASVILRAGETVEEQTVTGPDGRFTLSEALPPQATLVIRAGGGGWSRNGSTTAGDPWPPALRRWSPSPRRRNRR
jgi:hypothetical protein